MTIFKIITFVTAIGIVIISGIKLDSTKINSTAKGVWLLSLIGWMMVALITLFGDDCSGQSYNNKINKYTITEKEPDTNKLNAYLVYYYDSVNFQNQLIQSKHDRQSKWIPIAINIFSIACNAIGDGLNDNGQKIQGHIYNAISIAGLLCYIPLQNYHKDYWWKAPVSYIFIRSSIFDPIYSITRHRKWNYLDNSSSVTDRMWNYFGGQTAYPRFCFFVIGTTINF